MHDVFYDLSHSPVIDVYMMATPAMNCINKLLKCHIRDISMS